MKETVAVIKEVRATCPEEECDRINRIKWSELAFTGRSQEPFVKTHTCTGCGKDFKIVVRESM